MSVNKVIVLGRLGADPEFKQTRHGKPMAKMSVATNYAKKGADGEYEEQVEWHRVLAFSRNAEICNQYLEKGDQVCFEGRIQSRKWKDDNGVERTITEIIALRVTLLANGRKGGARRAA
jgi:single-strand DNA-binding protein